MVYREQAHTEREVAMTARRAIMDLHREFQGIWDVSPETLLKYAWRLATTPDCEKSPNHILRIMRMFVRNGHPAEALAAAIVSLRDDGAFDRAPARLVNPYADQQVSSEWGYPSSYAPLPMQAQASALERYYPDLHLDPKRLRMPPAADGFAPFVIPKLTSVASRWHINDPFGNGYVSLIHRLADVVQFVYRGLRFGFSKTPLDLKAFSRLEPLGSVKEALMRLEDAHPDTDFVVMNAQMGVRWRGSSMRRVRWHCEYADFDPIPRYREFVLPLYALLQHLLIQPQRLMDMSVLAMYSAGDYAPRMGFFGHDSIGLAFGHGELHLADYPPSRPDRMFGVPTGLVRR